MNYKTPAHNRAKAVIAAAAMAGAGIDFLPDAPNFRFEPVENLPLHNGKPSSRGKFAYQNRLKLKNWLPTGLDLAPQYNCPMKDDPWQFHAAKQAWHGGNPVPLRKWLAENPPVRAPEPVAEEPVQLALAA